MGIVVAEVPRPRQAPRKTLDPAGQIRFFPSTLSPRNPRSPPLEALPVFASGTGGVALVVALAFYFKVKAAPEGNAAMARIARYIREGAMAFLVREYKVL